MKTVIFAAAAAVVLSATPAFAQDDSFVGPRAEVIAGYDAIKTNSNDLGTPDGFLYGFGLGYDVRVSGAVLGLEAEYSDSTAKLNLGGGDSVDAARDLYVGARAGLPLGDTALVYVKAGYTNGRIEAGSVFADSDGVRVGGGVEYKLGANLFLKGEYRYSNYKYDLERHQVVGGVGIRF